MWETDRRLFIGLLSILAWPDVTSAQQDGFPDRPIRLIVPNPPGGPSDIAARFLGEPMRSNLGQAMIIDNRPGAAGMIGTMAAVHAPADGYTVLVTSRSNHIIAPLIQKNGQFEPQRDLLPVGMALKAVGLFVVNSQTPFKSLKDLVGYARANPGKLNYGSAGVGATNHIAMEQFKALAGVDLVHVPYKGAGPMITGLMGGEVQLSLLDFASAQSGLRSGTLRPLAQTGSRRHSTMPELPTLAETGFADYDPSFWIGLAVPRGTPGPIVLRLNQALNASVSDVQLKARAQVNGWELVGGAPQLLANAVAKDLVDYGGLIQKLGIKSM